MLRKSLLSLALQKVISLVFHSVYSEGSKLLSCYFHTVKNHTAGVAENNLERINERMAASTYFKFWFFAQLKPLVSNPLVTLHPEGEWSTEHDVLISYSAVPEFQSSAWDWIGLFKVTLLPRDSLTKMVNMTGGGS